MVAEMVPRLNLIISFIGSIGSTSIALLIPPVIELVSKKGLSEELTRGKLVTS